MTETTYRTSKTLVYPFSPRLRGNVAEHVSQWRRTEPEWTTEQCFSDVHASSAMPSLRLVLLEGADRAWTGGLCNRDAARGRHAISDAGGPIERDAPK